MSRYYLASATITNPKPEREIAITEALADFWDFEDVETTKNGLCTQEQGYLTAGTTEDEFARELAECVWAANQGFCEVTVVMTYLEELPCEEYLFAKQEEYD